MKIGGVCYCNRRRFQLEVVTYIMRTKKERRQEGQSSGCSDDTVWKIH